MSILHSTAAMTASRHVTDTKKLRSTWLKSICGIAMATLVCGYSTTFAAPSTTANIGVGSYSNSADPKVRGEQIYKTTCSVCHGEKGGGAMWGKLNPPPRDFTSPESYAKLSRERMIYSVTNGRPGTGMQPFGKQLPAKDIEAVVDHIRNNFIANGKPSDMTLPFPDGLKGDYVKGGVLFLKNCSPCHGARGNGQGPRAYFITPKPRNFLAADSRRWLNRPWLFKIISNGSMGTVMPSWNKVLSDQEIADIGEYVLHQFIQPGGKGNAPK